jgi:SAM-dependent methyltransferase
MFTASAEFYDAIYGAFKNYAAEASAIADVLKDVHPTARTVLDVACGTGEHAKYLRTAHGFEVDGVDLDPALLTVARRKVPEARFFEADMATFELGLRYDAVLCLFSSIGYLKSLDNVTAALRRFHAHLAQDGVVVVEPWFAPEVIRQGKGGPTYALVDGKKVERTSDLTVQGRVSRIVFTYRVVDAESTQTFEELHELGLFTPTEMLECFLDAGLDAAYDPAGLTGRGLYVARAAF